MGIGYVPDTHRIFPDLTIEENLIIAQRTAGTRTGPWNAERIYLLFPVLQPLRRLRGSQLSGGQQKMLAIGRALMRNPALLLLDEPAEGLAPRVVHRLVEVLREIREASVTILLADQNLHFCRKVADRAYIMEKGLMQFTGTMDVVWKNEDVVRRYLAV
jgi:branched-chain amino acid transport system ATP-binding protein